MILFSGLRVSATDYAEPVLRQRPAPQIRPREDSLTDLGSPGGLLLLHGVDFRLRIVDDALRRTADGIRRCGGRRSDFRLLRRWRHRLFRSPFSTAREEHGDGDEDGGGVF